MPTDDNSRPSEKRSWRARTGRIMRATIVLSVTLGAFLYLGYAICDFAIRLVLGGE
jgi:hypothetical protein